MLLFISLTFQPLLQQPIYYCIQCSLMFGDHTFSNLWLRPIIIIIIISFTSKKDYGGLFPDSANYFEDYVWPSYVRDLEVACHAHQDGTVREFSGVCWFVWLSGHFNALFVAQQPLLWAWTLTSVVEGATPIATPYLAPPPSMAQSFFFFLCVRAGMLDGAKSIPENLKELEMRIKEIVEQKTRTSKQ